MRAETLERYLEKFGEAPTMHWHGAPEGLDELMKAALARGTPVAAEELPGHPPDALV
jgi:hypothetical protein